MHFTRLLRWYAIPTAFLLVAGAARAQAPEPPASVPELPSDAPLELSTPAPEETKAKPLHPHGSAAVSEWSSWMGIDQRTPSIPGRDLQPGALSAGALPDVSNQSNGVAWATVTGPGFEFPLGWDKTSVETRLDPAQEQSQLGTTISRSMAVGDNLSVTMQNGVTLSQPLAHAPAQGQAWTSSQALRFNVLPTDTSVSVGANISSTDDKWLPSLSAEQKLFGTPLSVTGSVSETANGQTSKSFTAGFKRQW
jgi:hypothetical protein